MNYEHNSGVLCLTCQIKDHFTGCPFVQPFFSRTVVLNRNFNQTRKSTSIYSGDKIEIQNRIYKTQSLKNCFHRKCRKVKCFTVLPVAVKTRKLL